jgi:hypothetical protein
LATVHGHSIWRAARRPDTENVFAGDRHDDIGNVAGEDVDDRWPVWMVTLGVVTFCAAFWAGAYYVWDMVV